MGSDRAMEQLVQVAKTGALWWEVVYRPVALLEQPGSYRSQNPRLRLSPEGRGSTFPSFSTNPSLCAGVWDQKESAEDSLGLGVQVWASVAPGHDRTSVEGALPLPPTGLAPGTYRAVEAQPQPPCPLWVCSWPRVQREAWGTPAWVPGCALGPLRSTNAAPGRELATR